MSENFTKLRPNQIKAIETMLSAGSIDDAADAAGVQRRTVYNWLKEDNFSTALASAEAEALRLAAARFAGAVETALQTLLDIMEHSKSDKQRAAAAGRILSALPKIRLLGNIEATLAELLQNQEDLWQSNTKNRIRPG